MKILTKYFGEIEILDDAIINFPGGLLGFEDSKDFVLIDMPGNSHFKFLQDIHKSYVSFVMINPWDFFENYDIELSDIELEKIRITSLKDDNFSIYNVVTLGKTFDLSSANLIAPVVINNNEKLGRQIIVDNPKYTTKHPLLQEGLGA